MKLQAEKMRAAEFHLLNTVDWFTAKQSLGFYNQCGGG